MFNVTAVVSLLISLVIIYLVMYRPLYTKKEKLYYSSNSDQNEFDEKISLLETIAELDTDFEMGKLSKEDYETLSNEYKHGYLEKKEKS